MRAGILMVGRRPLLAGDERVPQDHDDRVPTQEHLGDIAVLVDWLRFLLALAALGDLGPHLLHILQHHVAMPGGGGTPGVRGEPSVRPSSSSTHRRRCRPGTRTAGAPMPPLPVLRLRLGQRTSPFWAPVSRPLKWSHSQCLPRRAAVTINQSIWNSCKDSEQGPGLR